MRPLLFILALVPAPALADVFTFQTPSGNIQCSGGEDFGGTSDVICEIIQRNGPPALPQPAACPGPWGLLLGFPPKVIWICRGNCSTSDIEQILRQNYDLIQTLEQDESVGILLLR
jgi:hypothetical protein